MPKLTIIESENQIKHFTEMKKVSFDPHKTYDEKGRRVDAATYAGRKYRVVNKQEMIHEGSHLVLRRILGILACIFSGTLALISPFIRGLFFKKETIRFAVLNPSTTPQPPLVKFPLEPVKNPSQAKPSETPENNNPSPQENLLPPHELPRASLPFLRELSLKPEDPLMKEISNIHFLSHAGNEKYYKDLLTLGLDPSKIQPDLLDQTFLVLYLQDIIKGNRESVNKVYNESSKAKMKILIEERILQLDQAIQIKERIERLKNTFIPLTIKDLLLPWHTSSLRYALMMDEELEQLTIADIQFIDIHLCSLYFGMRFSPLLSKKEYRADQEIQSLSPALHLADIVRIKNIHSFIPHLPALAMGLIADESIQFLEMKNLSEDQLTVLFWHSEKVKHLSMQQIEDAIPKLKDQSLLKNLSDAQISQFPISLMTSALLKFMLPTNHYLDERTKNFISALNTESIYKLHTYFSPAHWFYLKDEQILSLDFSKISLAKGVVENIFNDMPVGYGHLNKRERLIPQLTEEQIYSLAPHFPESFWQYFSDERIQQLDFARLLAHDQKQNKMIVNAIYDYLSGYLRHKDRAKRLLPTINTKHYEQIKDYLNESQKKLCPMHLQKK